MTKSRKPLGIKNYGEKTRKVDFLVKYVRPDKEDGKYLSDISGQPAIWHWRPDDEESYAAKE